MNSCAAADAGTWQNEHLLPNNITAVAVGDFNGDGLSDIASLGGTDVLIYLSLGGGTFAPPIDVLDAGANSAYFSPSAMTTVPSLAGGPDTLVVGSTYEGSPALSEITYADGGLSATGINQLSGATLPDSISAIACLAVDGGASGFLLTAPDDSNLYWASGGTVTVLYSYVSNLIPAPPGLGPIALADLNGDGLADVVVGTYHLPFFDGSDEAPQGAVLTLTQASPPTTPPTFNLDQQLDVPEPAAVAVADLDGDGLPDVLVASFIYGAGSVSIYAGNPLGGVYTSPVTLTTNAGPGAITIGDFDADGWPDIAVSCWNDVVGGGGVDVFLNGGCGANFLPPNPALPLLLNTLSTIPVGIAAGRLSQPDGGFDIVIADENGPGVFRSFASGCTGTALFVPAWDAGPLLAGSGNASAVISADFNNDGIADLAIGNSMGVFVLYGQDGGYSVPEQVLQLPPGFEEAPLPAQALALSFGNYHGDTNVDIAALLNVSGAGDQLAITFQQNVQQNDGGVDGGVPQFPTENGGPVWELTPPTGGAPLQLATATFNGDPMNSASIVFTTDKSNKLEKLNSQTFSPFATVTAANSGLNALTTGNFINGSLEPGLIAGGAGTDPNLYTLFNYGNGYVQSKVDAGPSETVALVTSDFDQDGNVDFAAASTQQGMIEVYFGNGQGGFAPVAITTGDAGPLAIAAGDFNGDGLPDIAALISGSPDHVQVFYSQGGCRTFTFATTLVAPGAGSGSLCTVADPNAIGGFDLVVAVADGGTSIWVPGY